MPTPCFAPVHGKREIHLRPPTPGNEPAFVLLIAEIRSRAEFGDVQRFVVDCSDIRALPTGVLAEFDALRDDLRRAEIDVVLVNRASELPALEHRDESAKVNTRHEAHRLRGPHATFLRAFRAGS
jgi:hypothetical protein